MGTDNGGGWLGGWLDHAFADDDPPTPTYNTPNPPVENTLWGEPTQDSTGSDWLSGSNDVPSGDGGGLIETIFGLLGF